MSLYHMLKFAQYSTTNIHAVPTDAQDLVLGIINNNPNNASKKPLANTQKVGLGSIEGTIGSYHDGLMKWSIPTEINARPKPKARKSRTVILYSTSLPVQSNRKRNVINQELILDLK